MENKIHLIIGLKAGEPLDILEDDKKVDVKTAHEIVENTSSADWVDYQWWMEAGLSGKINSRSMTKQEYKTAYHFYRYAYWQVEQDHQWYQWEQMLHEM